MPERSPVTPDDRGPRSSRTGTSGRGPLLLVAAVVVLGLIALYHDYRIPGPELNDRVLHKALVTYVADHWTEHWPVAPWIAKPATPPSRATESASRTLAINSANSAECRSGSAPPQLATSMPEDSNTSAARRPLMREDIWPSEDLALAVAAQKIKRLKTRPTPKKLESLSMDWKPWRAVAARLLWHYYIETVLKK